MVHTHLSYPLGLLVIGVLLLLFGRSLFWLFVALLGFVAGTEAAAYLMPHQSELFVLVIALVLGVIGALLAIFLQKIAIALAGFAGGGYLAAVLCGPLLGGAGAHHPTTWLCFVIGGIIGAILMTMFFNWALIILTSLHGAHLIVHSPLVPRFPHAYVPILVIALAVVGMIIQSATYRRRKVVVAE